MVSDLKDDLDLMPQAFLAGLGGYDWRTESDDIDPYKNPEDFQYDADVLRALKRACHSKLYAFANSSFMNSVNTSTTTVWNLTWWRTAYIACIAGFGVLTVAFALLYAASVVKNRKERT